MLLTHTCCYLPHSQALNPDRRVVFLDTSGLPGSSELVQGDGVSNPGEAGVVSRLLRGLLASGAEAFDIGLVSPYRAQVELIWFSNTQAYYFAWALILRKTCILSNTVQVAALARLAKTELLRHSSPGVEEGQQHHQQLEQIEALTIDRYQGRDKACIILSLVRSNADGRAGRLLRDRERINVALTRAKHKLMMVGCADVLRASTPVLGELLDEVDRRGWRLQLMPPPLAPLSEN
jgi:DNA replication ATP-dependent helicase Dna2